MLSRSSNILLYCKFLFTLYIIIGVYQVFNIQKKGISFPDFKKMATSDRSVFKMKEKLSDNFVLFVKLQFILMTNANKGRV